MKTNVIQIARFDTSENNVFSSVEGFCGPRSRMLSLEENQHTETLLTFYSKFLRGTAANCEATVKNAIGILKTVLRYIGLPPWEWTEDDISDFLNHKATVDDISISRHATYITYLRGFQNYVLESSSLANGIHQRFGMQPQRFVSNENAIAIKRKNEAKESKITTLTGENCQKLMNQFEIEIKQSKLLNSKSYQPNRRNKSIVSLLLMSGVRINELVNIRISDFSPDTKFPNFGPYALLTVVKGKGNKSRVVRMYNPFIREMMDWYVEEVRPVFLSTNTPDPDLLFLSERGGKLVPEQVRRMLHKIAALAGITTEVRPHILRHTYATQMKDIIGPEALQKQLGHKHLSTTLEIYYHQDPLQVGNQVVQGIQNFTNAINAMTKGLLDENND